jgi:hypothetical protein
MSDQSHYIHKAVIDGVWPKKDNRFALAALVAETIAVYYWSEAFAEGGQTRQQRSTLCVVGQRGLAEYAATATSKILAHLDKIQDRLQETEGFRFGCVIALRDALRLRRDRENTRPEYQDQCNVSTYRAKRTLDKYYKVGVKDVPTQFDIDGYQRGLKQIWTLNGFKTPLQVLDTYARSHNVRSSEGETNLGTA